MSKLSHRKLIYLVGPLESERSDTQWYYGHDEAKGAQVKTQKALPLSSASNYVWSFVLLRLWIVCGKQEWIKTATAVVQKITTLLLLMGNRPYFAWFTVICRFL